MPKKHSPSKRKGIPLGRSGGKMHRKATQKELLAIKIGRNEKCPCSSGKKYKKCCLNKKHFYTKEDAKTLGIGDN